MNILVILNRGRAAPYVMMDLNEHFNSMGHTSRMIRSEDLVDHGCDPLSREAFFAMSRKIQTFNPDVVIGYGGVSLLFFQIEKQGPLVNVLEVLQIPSVGIYYDNPFLREVFPFVAGMADARQYHMFIWDRYYVEELQKLGFRNTYYMPIAANTKRYHKINEQARDANEYSCDVSFVGSWSYKRELVLRKLLEFDLKIYGYGWEKASPRIKERFLGPADNITELPFIYNYSKINVNVTMEQGISSLNMRVFDVMACEGFLISDYKPDFRELFDYDNEAVCYQHVDELPELIQYYLTHEDERRRKARAARRRVLREHSYKNRAEFIIETLQKSGIG